MNNIVSITKHKEEELKELESRIANIYAIKDENSDTIEAIEAVIEKLESEVINSNPDYLKQKWGLDFSKKTDKPPIFLTSFVIILVVSSCLSPPIQH
jgi:superfamily I DNA and RNA helicase